MKDLSKRQFARACEKYGFRSKGILGYYDIGNGVCVSVWNAAGKSFHASFRARLAYLLKMRKENLKKKITTYGRIETILKMPFFRKRHKHIKVI